MITKVLFIYKNGFLKKVPFHYIKYNKTFFYPESIFYIIRISTELYYDFVLVNNKVCLGTERSPRVLFYDLQMSVLSTIENEKIHLYYVYLVSIKETSISTKGIPSTYFSKTSNRCIILPHNTLWVQSVYISKLNKSIPAAIMLSYSWERIYNLLKFYFSECSYRRRSKETNIQIFIKINGKGISFIHTSFGFLDHLIDQICVHANIDIGLIVKGDIHIDEHHTIEDTAIAIGMALSKAIKDKRGIVRYGFLLPMDDTLVQVAIDLGGRSNFVWKTSFDREKIGDVPTEMFSHFFKSFSDVAYCNLHIKAEGNNEHHKIEAIFKAFACALKMALSRNHYTDKLPSTKELL